MKEATNKMNVKLIENRDPSCGTDNYAVLIGNDYVGHVTWNLDLDGGLGMYELLTRTGEIAYFEDLDLLVKRYRK